MKKLKILIIIINFNYLILFVPAFAQSLCRTDTQILSDYARENNRVSVDKIANWSNPTFSLIEIDGIKKILSKFIYGNNKSAFNCYLSLDNSTIETISNKGKRLNVKSDSVSYQFNTDSLASICRSSVNKYLKEGCISGSEDGYSEKRHAIEYNNQANTQIISHIAFVSPKVCEAQNYCNIPGYGDALLKDQTSDWIARDEDTGSIKQVKKGEIIWRETFEDENIGKYSFNSIYNQFPDELGIRNKKENRNMNVGLYRDVGRSFYEVANKENFWLVSNKSTPTPRTGPDSAYEGKNYLYYEKGNAETTINPEIVSFDDINTMTLLIPSPQHVACNSNYLTLDFYIHAWGIRFPISNNFKITNMSNKLVSAARVSVREKEYKSLFSSNQSTGFSDKLFQRIYAVTDVTNPPWTNIKIAFTKANEYYQTVKIYPDSVSIDNSQFFEINNLIEFGDEADFAIDDMKLLCGDGVTANYFQ